MPLRVHTAIALCLAALACGGGGSTGPAPVASVTVDLAQSSISIGSTTTATATAKDASGNVLPGRAITWSSNNPNIATVSATGLVTAVRSGSAIISAATEGRSGTATVTVGVAAVATVTVSLSSSTILQGSTAQATATVRDAGGQVLTGRSVSWASDNSFVATVSNSGVVTARTAGTANIMATSGGVTGSATITVMAVPVASVTVSLVSSTIAVGATAQATATTKDANGSIIVGRFVAWSSDNTSVATVNSGGLVKGVGAGTANITATSEEKSGSATITVALPLGFGSSTEKIRILDVGTAFTPTLSGSSVGTTTFVSRATSVATVDAQGNITSVGEGQVWLVASAPGWAPDSVYVIVPRTSTGPVLRTDLTTFSVKTGGTTVVNIILDTRSTPIGGAELNVAYTTIETVFTNVSYSATGSPAPEVNNVQDGVFRLSLASGSPLAGELAIFQLTFTTPASNSSGFLTLTLIDIVSPTGADLLPVSTSTRIPIIVHD
jgi:uncharacterized protein YjdB